MTSQKNKLDNFDLPRVISIFTLENIILMPGTSIPLKVSSNKFNSLIKDLLQKDSLLGIVQPCGNHKKNTSLTNSNLPTIYQVGCLGKIVGYEEKDDSYMVKLKGKCRFIITEEIPSSPPHRMAMVNFDPFVRDLFEQNEHINRENILHFFEKHLDPSISKDILGRLTPLSDQLFINAICMSLQFTSAEKQVLLEAKNLQERTETLSALLSMGGDFFSKKDNSQLLV